MMLAIILTGLLLAIFDIANAGEVANLMDPRDSLLGETTIDDESLSLSLRMGANQGQLRSRRLVAANDVECTIYGMSIENENTIEYDGRKKRKMIPGDEDEWHCELDKKYSAEVLGLEDPLVRITGWAPVESDGVARVYGGDSDVPILIESGRSTIKVGRGIIDREEMTMHIDPTLAKVNGGRLDRRDLQSDEDEVIPIVGHRQVLVVRVSTNDYNAKPTSDQIQKYVYDNSVSIKNQYKECSFKKLKMHPFRGRTETGEEISEGVVTVKLNNEHSAKVREMVENGGKEPLSGGRNRAKVLSWCRIAATEKLGDLEAQFDHVMFILPRELKGLLALAIIHRWDSYYGDDWILRPSMPIHEVGHNLGLDHAGELGEYDDRVGYMGYSYNNYEGPKMCFNPVNNWYLGWYTEQTESYNAYYSGNGRLFTLNGVADYNPSMAESGGRKRLIVLRLTQSTRVWDFYIGYNRKKTINKETRESEDSVVILRKYAAAGTTSTSKKLGVLSNVGDYFEIENYNGGRSVYITYEEKKRRGKDIIIRVATAAPPPPSPPPTKSPTKTPTKNPTPEPRAPTSEPTKNPTARPTAEPTPTPPTRAPTPKPTAFGEIVDRDDLQYKGGEQRDCRWVADKVNERCQLNSKRKSIKLYWCRKTCEDAANFCVKNKTLKYGGRDDKNCEVWVAEDPAKRCENTWRKKQIKDYWCPTTCDPDCIPLPEESMNESMNMRMNMRGMMMSNRRTPNQRHSNIRVSRRRQGERLRFR